MGLKAATRRALTALINAAVSFLADAAANVPTAPVSVHLNLPSKHRHPPECGTGGCKKPRKNRKSSLRARRRAKRNRHKRR